MGKINVAFVNEPADHILITLDGKCFTCHEQIQFYRLVAHGFVTKGSMRLSRNEALELAAQIFKAAGDARDAENMQIKIKNLRTHLRKKLLKES